MSNSDLHDRDFHAWTNQQGGLPVPASAARLTARERSRSMRMTMLVALMIACLCGAARAGDPVALADRTAIDHVITAQIQAFRHDDGPAAFNFAAPAIQRKFGTAAQFLATVRSAYPPVYRPRSFTFGALSSDSGQVTQKVEIVGPDGTLSLALYDMEREPDGTWRIAGCTLVKSEQVDI